MLLQRLSLSRRGLKWRDQSKLLASDENVAIEWYPDEMIDDLLRAVCEDTVQASCLNQIRQLIGRMSVQLKSDMRSEDGASERSKTLKDGNIVTDDFLEALAEQWNCKVPEILTYACALGFVPYVLAMRRRSDKHHASAFAASAAGKPLDSSFCSQGSWINEYLRDVEAKAAAEMSSESDSDTETMRRSRRGKSGTKSRKRDRKSRKKQRVGDEQKADAQPTGTSQQGVEEIYGTNGEIVQRVIRTNALTQYQDGALLHSSAVGWEDGEGKGAGAAAPSSSGSEDDSDSGASSAADSSDDDDVYLQVPNFTIPSHKILQFGVATSKDTGESQLVCRMRGQGASSVSAGMAKNTVSIGGEDGILINVRFYIFTSFPVAGIVSPANAAQRPLVFSQVASRCWANVACERAEPPIYVEHLPDVGTTEMSYDAMSGKRMLDTRNENIMTSTYDTICMMLEGQSDGGRYASNNDASSSRISALCAQPDAKVVDALPGGVRAAYTASQPGEYLTRLSVIPPGLKQVAGPVAEAAADTHHMLLMFMRMQAGAYGIPLSTFIPGLSQMHDAELVESTLDATEAYYRNSLGGMFNEIWQDTNARVFARLEMRIENAMLYEIAHLIRDNYSSVINRTPYTGNALVGYRSPVAMSLPKRIGRQAHTYIPGLSADHGSGMDDIYASATGSESETDSDTSKKVEKSTSKREAKRRAAKMGGAANFSPNDLVTDSIARRRIESRSKMISTLLIRQLNLQQFGIKPVFESDRDCHRMVKAYDSGYVKWPVVRDAVAGYTNIDRSQMRRDDPRHALRMEQLEFEKQKARMMTDLQIESHRKLKASGVLDEQASAGQAKAGASSGNKPSKKAGVGGGASGSGKSSKMMEDGGQGKKSKDKEEEDPGKKSGASDTKRNGDDGKASSSPSERHGERSKLDDRKSAAHSPSKSSKKRPRDDDAKERSSLERA